MKLFIKVMLKDQICLRQVKVISYLFILNKNISNFNSPKNDHLLTNLRSLAQTSHCRGFKCVLFIRYFSSLIIKNVL